jgi:hypothetical protein
MKIDMFAAAEALSDQDLLAHIDRLAGRERNATAELVAHLAVLDARPSVYAALGYGSLFNYCTQALRLSEDAACNRIETAKVCRRFPVLLAHLASGAMTLSSVRLVGRHLTAENHETVIARAIGGTLREVEMLIAELAPRPDAPTFMRRLPRPSERPDVGDVVVAGTTSVLSEPPAATVTVTASAPPTSPAASAKVTRPIVKPTAPDRYRLQFTINQDTHDRLRRVQALLGREIPGGDPAAIFDCALKLLEAQLEKTKLAAVTRPSRSRLSVPRRIPRSAHLDRRRVTSRGRQDASSGGETELNAPSWRPADGGARSACTSSSITSSPTRGKAWRR